MSKSYKPNNESLCWNGKTFKGFAEGSLIEIRPKDTTVESVSKSKGTMSITLTLTEDSAKLIRDDIDNTEFAPSYDNERICPLCEGQNDFKVVESINGLPCEIKTYCTECGHKDYWAYGWYEPKDENGESI